MRFKRSHEQSGWQTADRLARRFAKDWMGRHPGLDHDDVTLSHKVFREVYRRARVWRGLAPRSNVRDEREILMRILRQVEADLNVKPSRRPPEVMDLLLRDLQATLWRQGMTAQTADLVGDL